MKLTKTLTDLGLEPKQAAVYGALLELGEATVVDISKKTKISRTNLYYILDGLKSLGFVYQTTTKKKTVYLAENPKDFLDKFRNRVEKFAENIEKLKEVKKVSSKPRIFYFDGAEGFKQVWDFLFKSGVKEYLITADPEEMLGFVKKGYITGKIIEEKVRLGIKSRQLVASSLYSKEVVAKDLEENRVSRILPHIYKIPFTKIIFDNRVACISPMIENFMFIIESEAFAKTERSVFEALWNSLPDLRHTNI